MKLFSKRVATELANRPPVEMEVKDWDARVFIRYIDGNTRNEWFETMNDGANGDMTVFGLKRMFKLLMMTLVDEDGQLMFGEDDMDLVAGLPLVGTRKIAERAASLNGLMVEDDAEK